MVPPTPESEVLRSSPLSESQPDGSLKSDDVLLDETALEERDRGCVFIPPENWSESELSESPSESLSDSEYDDELVGASMSLGIDASASPISQGKAEQVAACGAARDEDAFNGDCAGDVAPRGGDGCTAARSDVGTESPADGDSSATGGGGGGGIEETPPRGDDEAKLPSTATAGSFPIDTEECFGTERLCTAEGTARAATPNGGGGGGTDDVETLPPETTPCATNSGGGGGGIAGSFWCKDDSVAPPARRRRFTAAGRETVNAREEGDERGTREDGDETVA